SNSASRWARYSSTLRFLRRLGRERRGDTLEAIDTRALDEHGDARTERTPGLRRQGLGIVVPLRACPERRDGVARALADGEQSRHARSAGVAADLGVQLIGVLTQLGHLAQ